MFEEQSGLVGVEAVLSLRSVDDDMHPHKIDTRTPKDKTGFFANETQAERSKSSLLSQLRQDNRSVRCAQNFTERVIFCCIFFYTFLPSGFGGSALDITASRKRVPVVAWVAMEDTKEKAKPKIVAAWSSKIKDTATHRNSHFLLSTNVQSACIARIWRIQPADLLWRIKCDRTYHNFLKQTSGELWRCNWHPQLGHSRKHSLLLCSSTISLFFPSSHLKTEEQLQSFLRQKVQFLVKYISELVLTRQIVFCPMKTVCFQNKVFSKMTRKEQESAVGWNSVVTSWIVLKFQVRTDKRKGKAAHTNISRLRSMNFSDGFLIWLLLVVTAQNTKRQARFLSQDMKIWIVIWNVPGDKHRYTTNACSLLQNSTC